MKYISRLHYITQDIPGTSHVDLVKKACDEGINWIQLRIKNKNFEEWIDIASAARAITLEAGAKLIINDNVTIAKAVTADGVHLGKSDMNPVKARAILGTDCIIGGTANTFEDIIELHKAQVDYIGLGPFRFTSTKEKLSPILGADGYKSIVKQCETAPIQIPIIAIGGITNEDLPLLFECGVHGVAVASAIGLQHDFKKAVQNFKEFII